MNITVLAHMFRYELVCFRLIKFFNLFLIFGRSGSLLLCRLFPGCGERGCSLAVMSGLLTAVASLVEHRLEHVGFRGCGSGARELGLSSCGTQASLLLGLWELPGPGVKLVSPALAGKFSTTEPPGKAQE